MLAYSNKHSETIMGYTSIWHWLVVLLIVVLFFGTKRLTSGARDLGNAIREFKKGMQGDNETPAQLTNESRPNEPAQTAGPVSQPQPAASPQR